MDNVRRGKAIAALSIGESNNANGAYPHIPFSFNGGGCCGGAHYIESPSKGKSVANTDKMSRDINPIKISGFDNVMPLHRNLRVFTSMSTPNALEQNELAVENCVSEKQPIKDAFEE